VVDAVGEFETVTPLSSTSAHFDMLDGSTVYTLWNGTVLSSEVAGLVRIVRYSGLEASVDAATIDAASASLPIFVVLSQSKGFRFAVRRAHSPKSGQPPAAGARG
jgi:hypothetical protein|tara:strand:- start:18 stop:332 length:315 start_codon:yes stop_codon:yes gene_type:complete